RQPLKYPAQMRQMIGSPLMARPVKMNRAAVLPGARNTRIVKEAEHLARIEVGSDLDIYPIGCHGFPTGCSKSLSLSPTHPRPAETRPSRLRPKPKSFFNGLVGH